LAARRGCVGAVLVRRQIFLNAGRILPLWTRDDTRRQRHHRSNATAAVGASRPISAQIFGTQMSRFGAQCPDF
jgi:hypothetical protein